MKKICILSPDAVKIPLASTHSYTISIDGKHYPIEDKCTKAAATGIRAQKFAEYLSEDFEVTLLVPDLNYPSIMNIDSSNLTYSIEPYDYNACQWKFSKKLRDQFSRFDCIILQSTAGVGFKNINNLNTDTYIVLDGYIPLLAEFPAALSYHTNIKEKRKNWKRLLRQYTELLSRIDLLLSANDRQRYYYEGQLLLLSKLGINNFKQSNILKIPYGVDKKKSIERQPTDKLKLLWYGPFYPWYDFNFLIKELTNHKNISIDFYGIQHPRYTNFVNSSVDLTKITTSSNMKIIGEFGSEDPRKLFSNYDACILIAQDWIEDTYSHRARIFDILSYNIPVIINKGSSILEESPYLNDRLIYEVDKNDLRKSLEDIERFKNLLYVDTEAFHRLFNNQYNWNHVLEPLITKLKEELK